MYFDESGLIKDGKSHHVLIDLLALEELASQFNSVYNQHFTEIREESNCQL